MNKDWKRLIILWIVSIIISAMTLYSFRDVHFKNTKKLAEENARQQAEIQAQIEWYQQQEIQVIDEWLPTTWEMNLVLPAFFSNNWLDQIVARLWDLDIQLTFKYVGTISELKEIVQNSFFSNDMYLLPKDWIDSLDLEWIYVWENIKPYFANVFQDIVSGEENTFVPYSLDPLITIKKTLVWDIPTWWDIFTYVMLWTSNRQYSFPILWWTNNDDIDLIQAWDEPFENYFDTLYRQLKLIKDKKNANELNSMLDIDKIDILNKYNYTNFQNLYNLINKSNSNCERFPWNCLMSYKFADIKFGYLSDFDILDRYFSENDNDFDIANFTNIDSYYPARWWWFVVPKWSKNINLSTELIKQYLILANEWVDLWNNTLPAINSSYDEKKQDNKYRNIIQNEDIFEIMDWDLNLQNHFFSDSKNLDVLRWVYSPDIYVN